VCSSLYGFNREVLSSKGVRYTRRDLYSVINGAAVTQPEAYSIHGVEYEAADLNVGEPMLVGPIPEQSFRDAECLGCIPGTKS
jgi:hypothetical protein